MPKGRRYNKKKKENIGKMKEDIKMLIKKNKQERSVKDNNFITSVSASTGNLLNCFQCAQGDGLGDRNGLSIIAKSIHVNGLIQRIDSTNIVRIMVVQFESSADNSIVNFLENPNGNVTYLYQGVYSPFKVGGDCKYRILADKRYKVPSTEDFAIIDFKVDIPKSSNVMKFTSAADQIPQSNPVTIFAVSDSYVMDHPQVHMTVRQRFDR